MRISIIGAGEARTMHEEAWRGLADVVDPGAGVHAVSLCCDAREQSANIRRLIGLGVPIFAGLPLAKSASETRQLLQAAAVARVPLVPATWLRLTPAAQLARDAMFRGTIGAVRSVEITLPGEPSLLGTGLHAVDFAQYLLYQFESAYARSTTNGRRLTLTTKDDVVCDVLLGEWKPVFCWIHGQRGTIELGWKESIVHRHGSGSICIGEEMSGLYGMRLAAEKFQDVVRGYEAPWTTLDEISYLLDVVESAGQALVRNDTGTLELLAA